MAGRRQQDHGAVPHHVVAAAERREDRIVCRSEIDLPPFGIRQFDVLAQDPVALGMRLGELPPLIPADQQFCLGHMRYAPDVIDLVMVALLGVARERHGDIAVLREFARGERATHTSLPVF